MRCTIVFAVTLFVLIQVSTGNIRLVDNGYENLNILITDQVKEDPKLIDSIKVAFTDASALLFKATKNSTYFKSIRIVIPKKWKQVDSNMALPSVGLNGEYVRVDRTNQAGGGAPYVRGNLECGKPGWFMHLTEGFLNTVGDTPYGPQANTIVHEWGHLRWGLFDEYASIQLPGTTKPNQKIEFYNGNGQLRPVTCSGEIKGGAYRQNCNRSKPCKLNSITIPSECKFCPDQQQTAKASFMSSQWIHSMESFCDEDSPLTDPAVRHNSKSPNAQNNYCNGQSAWEVMRHHADFKDGNNQNAPIDIDTDPTFSIFQETGRVRVIVYDVSLSMIGTKIKQLTLASYVVIDNVIETGSWLGLVSFSSSATILATLKEIQSRNVRSEMKRNVPTSVVGGTSISAGLIAAIQVIDDSRFSTNGTEIIILSDGKSSPYLGIIPKLQQKGIIVHTISVTQNADADMAKLAVETGGKSFTYLETNTVSFVDVLSQAILTGTTDGETTEKVFGTKTFVSSAQPLEDHFTIDSGLGNTTRITIMKDSSNPITINITSPDGSMYTNTSSEDIMYITLDDNGPVGKYYFIVSTTTMSQVEIEITVTTHPVSDEVEVLRVTSAFSNSKLDFNILEEIRLYTNVEKAGRPVLNANVTAILASDRSFTARELSMKDTGTGADLIANDGVYSVFLQKTYFTSNGRYNIKVTVTGDGGAFTYTANSSTSSRASSIPGAVDEIDFTPAQLGEFQRQSIPGEIIVLNRVTNNKDTTPPAKISDLRIESITIGNETLDQTLAYTFVWTAVGDNMDIGTASSYEMRMDIDNQNVRMNFSQATTVPVNLTQPKPSGETERYTVNFSLDDCNGTCYLAVKAVDENGLSSDISNIVNVDIDFSYEPEEVFPDDDNVDEVTGVTAAISSTKAVTTTQNVIINTNLDTADGLSEGAIIGIAVGASVILIIVIALVLYLVHRRRYHAKQHDQQVQVNWTNSEVKTEQQTLFVESAS